MSENAQKSSDEIRRSREVAEASRETEWQGAGFLRDMFLGKFRLPLIHPYPLGEAERPEFRAWFSQFEAFLAEKVDPVEIDATGEYPAESAGYVGTKCLPEAPTSIYQEDCVEAATLLDVCAQHAAQGLLQQVSGGVQPGCFHVLLRQSALEMPRSPLTRFPLVLSIGCLKAYHVSFETALLGQLGRQLWRKPVGIIQVENNLARQLVRPIQPPDCTVKGHPSA